METIEIRENQNSFQVQEAFKTLRSNIEFSGEDVKVICVTSALPGDGKSTISFELACAFAENGKKTLLIDADLRKSVMQKHIRYGKPEYGLTHYLIGRNSMDDIIYRTTVQDLYIMFAGQQPPNPSELLGSERFNTLVKSARDVFDMVIIDTPPVGSVIDAAVVARNCDGVVLVLRDGEVSYRLAQRIKGQIETAGAKILGCVLNEVELSSSRYYGKYYGKRYGEYYGSYYGNENEKTVR